MTKYRCPDCKTISDEMKLLSTGRFPQIFDPPASEMKELLAKRRIPEEISQELLLCLCKKRWTWFDLEGYDVDIPIVPPPTEDEREAFFSTIRKAVFDADKYGSGVMMVLIKSYVWNVLSTGVHLKDGIATFDGVPVERSDRIDSDFYIIQHPPVREVISKQYRDLDTFRDDLRKAFHDAHKYGTGVMKVFVRKTIWDRHRTDTPPDMWEEFEGVPVEAVEGLQRDFFIIQHPPISETETHAWQ